MRRAIAVFALIVCQLTGLGVANAASVDLRLVAQNFNVASDRQFRFVFNVADDGLRDLMESSNTATLTLRAFGPVGNTTELDASLDASPAGEPVAVFGALTRRLERTPAGDFVVLVAPGRGGLALRQDGIYPIELLVSVGGEVRARLTTAVNFFAATTNVTRMKVSFVVGAPSTIDRPVLQPDGGFLVDDDTRGVLEDLVSIGLAEGGPLTLAIEPEVIDSLARSTSTTDIELLARLTSVMKRHESVQQTYVPFDPSSAQRAGLSETFDELLLAGRDVLDINNGDAPLNAQAWIARQPVDRDGIELLRRSGVTTVVITPNAAQASGSLDNYLKTYRVGSTVDESVAVKAIDPKFAELLTGDRGTPVVDAARIAASLVLSRQAVDDAGGDVRQLHAVLGNTRGEVPNPLVAVPLLIALDRAPQLNLVGISRANAVTGNDSTTTLPTIKRVDVGASRPTIDEVTSFVRITQELMPASSPQNDEWRRSLLVLNDDRFDQAALEAYAKGVRSRARLIRSSISIPDGLSFTLGSRTGTLRLPIRNESDVELTIGVSIVSAKLQLAGETRVVTIPANGSTDLVVDVVARANGRFPVDVKFTTSDGLHQIGQTIRIGARVTTISGLGQLVSGAAILILATWWVAHWRKRKRANALENHPAVR